MNLLSSSEFQLSNTSDLIEVRVARKNIEAEGIASFELVRPDGGALPAFEPGAHLDDVTGLFRKAAALTTLYELECDRGLTPAQDRRQNLLETQVAQFCSEHNLQGEVCRDPRGAAVQIAGGRVCLW